MPHLVIEYSSNLEPALPVQRLVDRVHEAVVDAGIFPLGGVRTRAVGRQHYRIADGHPENAFVHASLRIGHGRDAVTKQRVGEGVFGALCAALDEALGDRPLAVSFELEEIDPATSFRRNNLHDLIGTRRRATGTPNQGAGGRP